MKIVFHGGNAASFRAGLEQFLHDPHEILVLPDRIETPADRTAFEEAEVIVGVKLTATDPRPTKLRLYHAPAAGTDAIDIHCLPPGAKLCNAFGHEHAIAEYVMAALLSRHVPLVRADARLREGHWDFWAGKPGALRTELGDQTIGLLGYGHIGKAIAQRARAFGMGVLACNRSPIAGDPLIDQAFDFGELSSFMGKADAIVVSLPLTEATRGIVNANNLAAMRPDAVILNVGRGPVIDESALFSALSRGSIGGAIIDTWYQYPMPEKPETLPASLPFHTLANVLMTPHMSGWTNGTVRRRQETVAENIRRLAAGKPLLNMIF
jgi:phosphoglycerate dehydrogenase-like enzyme